MLTKIAGLVRGLTAPFYAEGAADMPFAINSRGEAIVSQGLPELTDLVRMGRSYQAMTSAAIAPLAAMPTTAVGLGIWNGEPDGGASYAIDSIACVEIVVDTTQQNELALFAMLNRGRVAAITDAALVIRGLSGTTYKGSARTLLTGTAVVNDGWTPHGTSGPGAAAVAGGIWRVTDVPLRGLYLVRPGGFFGIHAVKLAATASQMHFVIRWHEVQLIVAS